MSESEVDSAFESLARHARHMSALFDNIMEIARLESGSQLACAPTDLGRAVADALEIAPPPPTVTVELVADQTFTASAETTTLSRVVANLLTNAYRYGGPPVVVRMNPAGPRTRI